MSSIIKSQKVSVGIPVNIDTKYIRRASEYVAIDNESGSTLISRSFEQKFGTEMEVERERVLNKYIKEAQEKSELLFETEMKKAKAEGISLAKEESERIIFEAQNESQKIIDECIELKERAFKEYKDYLLSVESDVISLALDIAEKIVNKHIEEDGDYVIQILSEAMGKVTSKKDVILKVSQEDYSTIIGNMKTLLAQIEGFGDVNVVKDEALCKGSCIVETPFGIIDSSVETRVNQVKKELEKILNR